MTVVPFDLLTLFLLVDIYVLNEACFRYRDALPPAVIHCFTGTAAEAEKYVEMGLYIGLTGLQTFHFQRLLLASLQMRLRCERFAALVKLNVGFFQKFA